MTPQSRRHAGVTTPAPVTIDGPSEARRPRVTNPSGPGIVTSEQRGNRERYHSAPTKTPAAEPYVYVDASLAYKQADRYTKLKSYSYGGYKYKSGHSSHYGFSYNNHYGYGYGCHYKPGFSISFSFGTNHYPYYCPPKYYGSYARYSYGYGYCNTYGGYYSSYYDYCPPVTYYDYGSYYNVTYRNYIGAGYYEVVDSAPYYEVVSSYSQMPYAEGWKELSSGSARSAFRTFSKFAAQNLDDGIPKIGYAIASAMLGDDRRAAWAMRRAFIVDPYGADVVRFDERLLRRIDQLAERYAKQADNSSNPDADFMLAALSYLIQDDQLASVAIDNAIQRGDRSEAAANLKAMIPTVEYSFED